MWIRGACERSQNLKEPLKVAEKNGNGKRFTDITKHQIFLFIEHTNKQFKIKIGRRITSSSYDLCHEKYSLPVPYLQVPKLHDCLLLRSIQNDELSGKHP